MSEGSGSSKTTYWPGLDGVRGVAIAGVVVFHTRLTLLPGGGFGVDVFFVLSGFLITLILTKQWRAVGRLDLGRFYARRALRLLPASCVAIPVGLAVTWLSVPSLRPGLVHAAIAAFGFIGDFRAAKNPDLMGVFLPYWSLALEEQFYVLWPPALFLLLRARLRPVLLVTVTVTAAVAASAWHQIAYGHVAFSDLLYRPDLRVEGILLGCVLGLLVGFELVPSAAWFRWMVQAGALAGAVLLPVIMIRLEWFPDPVRWTLVVALVSGFVILERVTAPTRALSLVLEWPALVWLGKISYSLYVIHVPAVVLVRSHITGSAAVVPAVVLSVVAAALLHYTVEAPFLRMKRRLTSEVGSGRDVGR